MTFAALASMGKQIEISITDDQEKTKHTAVMELQPASRGGVEARDFDWLNYYSQCREFLLALGTKFISLLTQASVFAAALCAAMITLRDKLAAGGSWLFLGLGLLGCLPLFVYWRFIVGYRRQIQETGDLLHDLEKEFGRLPENLRLLHRLRKKAPIYGSTITKAIADLYPLILIVLVLGFAVILAVMGNPPADVTSSVRVGPDILWSLAAVPFGILFCFGPGLLIWWLTKN